MSGTSSWNADGTIEHLLESLREHLLQRPSCEGRLERYERGEELGRGGMGVVYRAWDRKLEREVALKVLRDDGGLRPIDRVRFQREAEATAQLSHPNVVTLLDVAQDNGQMFLAMELIQGVPLSRILEAGQDNLRSTLELLRKVALGIHHAHEKGIVHRDLKPSNILVTPEGEPKIVDFGLARVIHRETIVTSKGTPLGTLDYMAPEQVRGATQEINRRADVYALGAILYQMLMGKIPFEGDTPVAVAHKILHEEPQFKPSIAMNLKTICLKAMEKDPHFRYSTAKEFAEDLERFLGGAPIKARHRWKKRKVLAISLVLAPVITIAFLLFLPGAEPKPLTKHEQLLSLHQRIKPMEALIRETRSHFYIKGADIHNRIEKLEKALCDLEELTQDSIYAQSTDLWRILGMGWYFIGNDRRAEKTLLRAQELAPDEGEIAYYLGRIYLERSLAVLLIPAEERDAKHRAQSMELGKKAMNSFQHSLTKWGGGEEIDRQIAQAYRALLKGNIEEGLGLCTEGLRRFDGQIGSEEFWNLRGAVWNGRNKIDAYSRAIEIRPHYAWGYFMRACAREDRSDLDEQISDYTEAIRLRPYFSEAYYNRGCARGDKGNLDGAILDFTEVIRFNPRYVAAYIGRAIIRTRKEDLEGAIADYTKALRIDPQSVWAYVERGIVRRKNGDLEGAIADHSEAIRLDPQCAKAYNNRAIDYSEKKNWELARTDYDEAIRLDPYHSNAWYCRGLLRDKVGDLKGAVADYEKALEVAPEAWPYRAQTQNRLHELQR